MVRARYNSADEEYPLFIRCEAPHNQLIKQIPFRHFSYAELAMQRSYFLKPLEEKYTQWQWRMMCSFDYKQSK